MRIRKIGLNRARRPLTRRKILPIALLLFAAGAAAFSLATRYSRERGESERARRSELLREAKRLEAQGPPKVFTPGLSVGGHRWVWGEEGPYVIGTLSNKGPRRFDYVEVRVVLYGAGGAGAGAAMGEVRDLRPGGKKTFRIPVRGIGGTGAAPARYEFVGVEGFAVAE